MKRIIDKNETDEKRGINLAYDNLFLKFEEFAMDLKFALLKDVNDILMLLKKWSNRK